jgi:hypothetical protein
MDAALQHKSYRDDVAYDVIFLAPAACADVLEKTLRQARNRINHFRSFGMQDSLKSAEILLQLVDQPPSSTVNDLLGQTYTSSLLYFVSGVCEDTDDDTPIVGMERFFSGRPPFPTRGRSADRRGCKLL